MLVVADVNTIWRLKPFLALSTYRPVTGLAPVDMITAWKRQRWPFCKFSQERIGGGFVCHPIVLMPGWSVRFSKITMPQIWRRIPKICGAMNAKPKYLVATIPQYYPLLKQAPTSVKKIYYASDDYRQYSGWDTKEIVQFERLIIELADIVFFVSTKLAERAKEEYPGSSHKIYVSMNATDSSSIDSRHVITRPPAPYEALIRPILGVVGGINQSLDFELLLRCADLPETGTLLFVGPILEPSLPGLKPLINHPKCVFAGAQPHSELSQWLDCLDISLIPYRATNFNLYRSPMRLFDHLASGKPIVATNGCHQVVEFNNVVYIANTADEFINKISSLIKDKEREHLVEKRLQLARENTWDVRADFINHVILNQYSYQ